MSKVKTALMCDACNGSGEIFSPLTGRAACPFCNGRGFHSPGGYRHV